MKYRQQRPRMYRLIFSGVESEYERRIAYSYLDNALARAASILARGATDMRIIEVHDLPNGDKRDGVSLAGGSAEGGTFSFSIARHGAQVIKRETKPLWWPAWVSKKNGKD